MKRKIFQLLIIVFVVSSTCFAQEPQKVAVTNCSCKPDQTQCSAEALFMSCCFCCQPGNTCGSWTAFGLCGCRCENASQPTTNSKTTNNINPVNFFPDKFSEFLLYLDSNKVQTAGFKEYLRQLISGKSTLKDGNGLTYYRLEGKSLQIFTDRYLNDMNSLILDTRVSEILSAYFKAHEKR